MELAELEMKLKEVYESSALIQKPLVFGKGRVGSEIFLIGEAPGAEEEKQGQPFVGKAGKNLSMFLEKLKLKRDDVYITNVVKIRPSRINPKTGREVNRQPGRDELNLFAPFLFEELKIVLPKIIVTLGNTPLHTVLEDEKATIGTLHGRIVEKGELKIFPLYHPAAIIYNRHLMDTYNEDINKLKMYLDLY